MATAKLSQSEERGPERFTFFYATATPFSQFHPSTFKGVSLFSETGEETTFTCAEQWMMLNKAELFKDHEIAQKIRVAGYDPAYIKKLGRDVRNFDLGVWTQHNKRIIYEGNKLKFSQNPELLRKLKATQGTTLVEASQNDRVYGIGLVASDPRAKSRKTWMGRNLLGECLTNLRDEFMSS